MNPHLSAIKQLAANAWYVPASALEGRSRTGRIAAARMAAIWVCNEVAMCNHSDIAGAFGRKRPTISYAIRAAENRRSTEPRFKAATDALKAEVSLPKRDRRQIDLRACTGDATADIISLLRQLQKAIETVLSETDKPQ
jgi:hypothetical protein